MTSILALTTVSLLFLLLVTLSLNPTPVHSLAPAPAATAAFTADITQPRTRLAPTVYDSFGSSHGSTTLRQRWRDHLATTRADIPFRRVRFHGILDDDLSTYLNGQANNALVFDTLDFLVAQHVTPTIEIGFMPELLAADPTLTNFHYKGGISPPASWAAWRSFIGQFVGLIVERYSLAVVREWRFEVWNEPNCGFYALANCCGEQCGNQTAYFELYANTAAAIKSVDTSLAVGGPATAQLGWIPDFLKATAAMGAPVDFVSSHLYPTDFANQTRDSFMDSIAASAALARAARIPFLITEYNAGLGAPAGDAVPLLDSSYAAAFLLHQHLRAQAVEGLLSMSYWTFTDFGFEEQGVDPLPWHPGYAKFGVQTSYGVKKPIYRAYQFISDWRAATAVPVTAGSGGGRGGEYASVGGAVVGATDGLVDCLVAVADGGVVTILLNNFDIADGVAAPPPAAQVTVTLTGFAAGGRDALPANATVEYIDGAHANPMAVWVAAGAPLYPTADEIAAEAAVSVVIPQQVAVKAAGSGSVSVTVTLQPYSVARVRLVVPPASVAQSEATSQKSAALQKKTRRNQPRK